MGVDLSLEPGPSSLPVLPMVAGVAGVAKALSAALFVGVMGCWRGSVLELFKTAAASRVLASSPHRKKSHLLG